MHAMLFFLLAQTTKPVNPPGDWHAALNSFLVTTLSVAGLVLTALLIPWINLQRMKIVAQTESIKKQGNVSDEQARTIMSERVKKSVVGLAELFADHKYPILAQRILRGELTDPDKIKEELRSWGDQLKTSLMSQLDAQSIDAIAVIGEGYIDALIERAAAAVSPFPGKDSALALLKGGAQEIIEHGVNYVRSKNRVAPDGAIPLPPAAAAAISAGGSTGGTSMAPPPAAAVSVAQQTTNDLPSLLFPADPTGDAAKPAPAMQANEKHKDPVRVDRVTASGPVRPVTPPKPMKPPMQARSVFNDTASIQRQNF